MEYGDILQIQPSSSDQKPFYLQYVHDDPEYTTYKDKQDRRIWLDKNIIDSFEIALPQVVSVKVVDQKQ
ncbi:unnamed protein product, partial [Anisakis simplex]